MLLAVTNPNSSAPRSYLCQLQFSIVPSRPLIVLPVDSLWRSHGERPAVIFAKVHFIQGDILCPIPTDICRKASLSNSRSDYVPLCMIAVFLLNTSCHSSYLTLYSRTRRQHLFPCFIYEVRNPLSRPWMGDLLLGLLPGALLRFSNGS